jgi:S-formylglutathione hydrolase FrmB
VNHQLNWHRTEISGKPVDLYEPPGAAAQAALLYLHPVGLESLAENAAYTAELARHRLACCAPFGARSWWTDRISTDFDANISAEKYLLEQVVPWMISRWNLSPRALAVAGISMGGQGAIRLGFKYPQHFPIVASVAGAFDYHEWYGRGTSIDELYRTREACRQDTAILQLQQSRFPPHIWFACDPTDVDWIQGNDRLQEKLTAIGIPHTADLETQAGGHTWPYFDSMAAQMVKFIAAALQEQSRRLL